MNRTTARLAVTVAGIGALTGLAVGAAHADEPEESGAGQTSSQTSDEGSDEGAGQEDATAAPEGLAPNYVLQGAPGLPIGDPVSNVFTVAAPAYGVLGALG